MKKYYNITFRWYDTTTYCTNIAHAESAEEVTVHYLNAGHSWVSEPVEATEYDIANGRRRGIPFVEIATPVFNPEQNKEGHSYEK